MLLTRIPVWLVGALLLSVMACNEEGTSDVRAALALVISDPPEGVMTVDYVIECGDERFVGEFEVIGDRDPPVFEAFVGVPVGECKIMLTASDASGASLCTGDTTVTVVENMKVPANITLLCPPHGGLGAGSIEIGATFEEMDVNLCPFIHVLNAIPSVIEEGFDSTVIQVRASDPDSDSVVTSLTASSGQIAEPHKDETIFTCAQPGRVTIRARVSDGQPRCDVERTTTVYCPSGHGTGGTGGGGGTGGTGGDVGSLTCPCFSTLEVDGLRKSCTAYRNTSSATVFGVDNNGCQHVYQVVIALDDIGGHCMNLSEPQSGNGCGELTGPRPTRIGPVAFTTCDAALVCPILE